MPRDETIFRGAASRLLVPAVCLAPALWLCVAVLAQCLGTLYTETVCNKPKSQDGKKHIKVNFSGGTEGRPNEQEERAMQAAMDEWNRFSSTTGVVFERAGANEAADLSFVYSTNSRATIGCAAYQPDHDGIYWGLSSGRGARPRGSERLSRRPRSCMSWGTSSA